jgi:hypothetical protein
MIEEPRCYARKCKHFIGAAQKDEEEVGEYVICVAFPDGEGIPGEIAYGDNLHTKRFPKQRNNIIYEKDPRE